MITTTGRRADQWAPTQLLPLVRHRREARR